MSGRPAPEVADGALRAAFEKVGELYAEIARMLPLAAMVDPCPYHAAVPGAKGRDWIDSCSRRVDAYAKRLCVELPEKLKKERMP